jgi:hypothetical protein
MKRYLLLIITLFSLHACNTYKHAQKDIYAGNFDQALDNMLKKYAKGNIKDKDIARWSSTFNTAYAKANSQNIDEIYKSQYMPEGSDKYRSILGNYSSLQGRYDKLKPYLPIRVNGEIIPINNENYSRQLENASLKLADALYVEAELLMKSNNKFESRLAYDKYTEISQLIPNYTKIQDKMDRAYQKGLTHILINVHNDSRSVLPRDLHRDLTYIQTNNQAQFWQKYHTQATNMNYDYNLELNFRDIAVTPLFIDREHNTYKREWIDSTEFAKDRNGKTIKDSLGQAVKLFLKKAVQCRVNTQFHKKSTRVISEFILTDNQGTIISRLAPIESNVDFNQITYSIDGDEHALDRDLLKKIHCQKPVLIPTDEQMVFDCGQDIKSKFSNFVLSQVGDR